jgi:hypothetical protein
MRIRYLENMKKPLGNQILKIVIRQNVQKDDIGLSFII